MKKHIKELLYFMRKEGIDEEKAWRIIEQSEIARLRNENPKLDEDKLIQEIRQYRQTQTDYNEA